MEKILTLLFIFPIVPFLNIFSQEDTVKLKSQINKLIQFNESLEHRLDELEKTIKCQECGISFNPKETMAS